MKFLYWLVTALIGALLVSFALSNDTGTTVSFFPLPGSLSGPLYLVVLAALLVGFLFGELVAWINGRRARRLARERARRIEALERELAATQARLAETAPASLPLLTSTGRR